VTATPWIDGLLTAIPIAGAAVLMHATRSWAVVREMLFALQGAGLHPDLRWFWLAWVLALAALAWRAGRQR